MDLQNDMQNGISSEKICSVFWIFKKTVSIFSCKQTLIGLIGLYKTHDYFYFNCKFSTNKV